MTKPRIISHLEQVGEDGTAEEFKDALNKFGHDAAAVDALDKGLKKQARYEDSGDYCSPSSSGYKRMIAKQKLLQDFDLQRGVFANFNAAAAVTPSSAAAPRQAPSHAKEIRALETQVSDLQRQVDDLTRRLDAVESRPTVSLPDRIRLKR